MDTQIKNLVFSGGGVLGISYLGALEYLYKTQLISPVINVAGTSAGAITACLVCFNLPFNTLHKLSDSLDYRKIPQKYDTTEPPRIIPQSVKDQFNKLTDSFDCAFRLLKSYGWYSSQYFYEWIQSCIATQFDSTKKSPPYTFADFKDASLHINQRPFKDLSIIGTDISLAISRVFSYETSPDMEVAEAVRISMSVPLLFQSIPYTCNINNKPCPGIYIDGGTLYNYPINLYDHQYPPSDTLGMYFKSSVSPPPIKNLVDFISVTLSCITSLQNAIVETHPLDVIRSIRIPTGDVSSFDFNVVPGDATYNFLYQQGYGSAEAHFSLLNYNKLQK